MCNRFKSQPPSAENTINRPRQSQSGQGGLGTGRIDRQPMGTAYPPPYGLHAGSTSSLNGQPYHSRISIFH